MHFNKNYRLNKNTSLIAKHLPEAYGIKDSCICLPATKFELIVHIANLKNKTQI